MPFRSTQLIAATVFTCLVLWFTISSRGLVGVSQAQIQRPDALDANDEQPFYDIPAYGHLMGHGILNLTDPRIQVSRIHISVSQADVQPLPLMQSLDISIPTSTAVTITNDNELSPQPSAGQSTLKIPHLVSTQPDASSYLFGVATTYTRLHTSLDTMSHWLSNSSARLLAHMEPSLDPDLPALVHAKAASLSISLLTIDSHHTYLDRWFSLLPTMHANSLPEIQTQWYIFLDDDTFFPSLSNLVDTFATKYPNPATTPYYIGTPTDDALQLSNFGLYAYGGGGIFLSSALLTTLLPHYRTCMAHPNTGDKMLANCINQHTTTRLSWEHGLHQLDLHGDQSGFYEALRPQPLSVHHWKSGEFGTGFNMLNSTRVTEVCGEECLWQKFRLKDDWVLTNGYSLVRYSDYDLRHRDLGSDVSMERTWDFFYPGGKDSHFEAMLGPIRRRDVKKMSFRMESAIVEEMDGGTKVKQLYVKRRRREELGEVEGQGVVEGVIEVEWSRV